MKRIMHKTKLFLIKKKNPIFLKYHDETSTFEHLNVFQGISNQLDATEINLDDEIYVMCLIGLLSDGWETLIVSFFYYTPNNAVTLKIVKESMLMRKTTKMTEIYCIESSVAY